MSKLTKLTIIAETASGDTYRAVINPDIDLEGYSLPGTNPGSYEILDAVADKALDVINKLG